MDIFGIGETGSMIALVIAGIMVVVAGTMISNWTRRRAGRRRGAETGSRRARGAARHVSRDAGAVAESIADQVPRIAALERAQADTAARLAEIAAGQAAPEERLKAMASQMLGLIRDKNATLETALAGLDQLRARMNTLEQIGDAAEARGLLEALEARIATGRDADAEARGLLEARLRALETADRNPFGEIADQLTRLYSQKDAAVETVLGKLGPLEARIADIEAAAPAVPAALERLQAEIDTLRNGVTSAAHLLEGMQNAVGSSEDLAARVAAVEADGSALSEAITARLDVMARELQSRDPEAALTGLEARLDGLRVAAEAGTAALADRIAALESPGENPFAEISGELARLYSQKDAAVEAVLGKLGPLEAKIDAVEGRLDGFDAEAVLDRFAERFEVVQTRLAALEDPGESPFAEISAQLTRLYAQKDATVETVFARLAPLEARLAGMEQALAAADPKAALAVLEDKVDWQGARLEQIVEARDSDRDAAGARLSALERDMAARDPQVLLDGFATRLEALAGRVGALEDPGESPFAEISAQLTRLYAQKDATVETVFARLAPLEARLAGMEQALASADPKAALAALEARLEGQGARLEQLAEAGEATGERIVALERDMAASDPQVLLDRVAARFEAVQTRLAALEDPGESPFAEISAQLTRLYAQKDATVETVFARLAPLETRLGDVEDALTSSDPKAALAALEVRMDALKETQAEQGGTVADLAGRLERLSEITAGAAEALRGRLDALERDRAENDPVAMIAGFADRMAGMQRRLEVLEVPGESPFAEISDQLTRLYAQKDATVETVFARLAPLEARLAEIESDLVTRDPAPALAGLAERLAGMEALPPRLAVLEDTAARTDALDAVSARISALDGAAARADRLDAVAARLDALDWAQDEVADRLVALSVSGARMAETARDAAREEARVAVAPFAGIAEQLGTLFSRKEAAVEAVLERLAPVEARLADLEARPWDPEADDARAEIQAIASQMIAARTAADQTALLAERLAVLEASLPRLSAEQSRMMRATAGQGEGAAIRPAGSRPRAAFGEPDPGRVLPAALDGAAPGGMEEVWALPRLVSLHHRQ